MPIEPKETALPVVDMQNGFCDPQGAMARAGLNYQQHNLIICGVATNYCVESTIRDAYARDYDILVVEDRVATLWEDLHKATLRNVEMFYGTVVALEKLGDTIGAPG